MFRSGKSFELLAWLAWLGWLLTSGLPGLLGLAGRAWLAAPRWLGLAGLAAGPGVGAFWRSLARLAWLAGPGEASLGLAWLAGFGPLGGPSLAGCAGWA